LNFLKLSDNQKKNVFCCEIKILKASRALNLPDKNSDGNCVVKAHSIFLAIMGVNGTALSFASFASWIIMRGDGKGELHFPLFLNYLLVVAGPAAWIVTIEWSVTGCVTRPRDKMVGDYNYSRVYER